MGRVLPMDAAAYRQVLESIHSGIGELDTTGYCWRAADGTNSDRWTQARLTDGKQPHLAVSVLPRGTMIVEGSSMLWAFEARYTVRWVATDRADSEARAMASAHDLWLFLTQWSSGGCRAAPGEIDLTPQETSTAEISISFDLVVPWRA